MVRGVRVSINKQHDLRGSRAAALEARHCTATEHVVHSARTPKARTDCTTLGHPAGDEWHAENEYQKGKDTRKCSNDIRGTDTSLAL